MSQMLPKDLLKDAEKGNRTAEMLGERLSMPEAVSAGNLSNRANGPRAGIAGMTIEEMSQYFRLHGAQLSSGDTIVYDRLPGNMR